MRSIIREVKGVKRELTKWFLTAISMCIVTVSTAVVASEEDSFADAKSRLEAGLSAMVGGAITIDRVSATESEDLIEISIVDGPILYATRNGDFLLLNGDLLKVTSSSISNLSEERRIADRIALLGELDTNDMIVFSPLEPAKAHITVFTDITCGFCRKLHLEMDDFNRLGIEVRYLAFPRGGMASQGAKQLATAWCARNREATLTSLKSGVEMPLNDCEGNPVAEHYALGNRLGVRGTPAIVTSDGQMIPGYRSAADIASLLGIE
jgi:thiol:disulfide interchange protein DsbC